MHNSILELSVKREFMGSIRSGEKYAGACVLRERLDGSSEEILNVGHFTHWLKYK